MIKIENISFDKCIKCTACTIYCPVARVTHRFPGPKQAGPDTERLRKKSPELLDESLKYCTNCKRCEIACPSNVKIADMIQNSKGNFFKKRIRLRDFLLANTDLLGGTATQISMFMNFITGFKPVKYLMDRLLKIPSQRVFPRYESGSFRDRFRKIRKDQLAYKHRVIYFHGCYVNYNDHELGMDTVKVLNSLNTGVAITNEKCCGVPFIANGYLRRARKNAVYNISRLSDAIEDSNNTIVSASSSCTYALKYEYPNLLEIDNSNIDNNIEFITRYIYNRFNKGEIPSMQPVNLKAAYHAPCHLERMGGVIYTIDILKKIPSLELHLIHTECCGIAGTYGFKREFYKISQDIGKDLFMKIEKINPHVVISDCETCKWQIEMNTSYKVLHPITVLARALEK